MVDNKNKLAFQLLKKIYLADPLIQRENTQKNIQFKN